MNDNNKFEKLASFISSNRMPQFDDTKNQINDLEKFISDVNEKNVRFYNPVSSVI